jgi:hypothetical protein
MLTVYTIFNNGVGPRALSRGLSDKAFIRMTFPVVSILSTPFIDRKLVLGMNIVQSELSTVNPVLKFTIYIWALDSYAMCTSSVYQPIKFPLR